MRFGSVCSGVEAASLAWEPIGWQPQFFSEIDAFPSAVLAERWPDVPNFGDMTKFKEWPDADIDVLVGGTPCQSFSVAGLRRGLADPRGNLMLTYLAIAERYRPKWLAWENVPGVLSSNAGRDFGSLLGGLGKLGYGFAYRVLDAQYFGVPQRRRRVFVVGYLGDWRRAAAVLFERESMQGNPAPRRTTREAATYDTAPCLRASGVGTERIGDTRGADCVIAMGTGQSNAAISIDQAPTLTCRHEAPIVCHGSQDPCVQRDTAFTVGRNNGQENVVCLQGSMIRGESAGGGPAGKGWRDDGNAFTLLADTHAHAVASEYSVRRLMPIECERLQGFPDNHTNIKYRGRPAADSHRYKACGNSMAVPVMRWIGERIQRFS